MPDLRGRLLDALQRADQESSDYDLNPGVVLPENRVLRPAAVLIGVTDTAQVVLTKRSARLKHHPGQIAFPGGKQDDTDTDLADTALREAHEEIGLARDQVEIVGKLPPHETVTSFAVTPFVALIRGNFTPIPERGEVDEVFHVPLEFVTNPANFSVQGRRWQGQIRSYYTVPFGPYYIWGATARMLYSLAQGMSK
jgi:8-oxo-dGTP pyrophosphatase MutT (NUDIX family)